MPIRTQIWTVGAQPAPLKNAVLASEQFLEDMIVSAPALLSEDWLLIGRQESTGQGGRIDLLALAPDASLVLIELKRERTPREVVAQALDYAVWVERLQTNDIEAIYQRFKPGADLAADFQARFGAPLEAEALNQSHQIVIVAAELDASSERIVGYLSERDIAINVLCFQVFQLGEQQLISRAWLLDPTEAPQASSASKPGMPAEPWNGEFYGSFGHSSTRDWAEARHFGFICGGGGSWYSNSLKMLAPGDRVWVNVPGAGYVGVAKVTGHATPRQGLLPAAQRRGTPSAGCAASGLPPRVRRRPRALRILRAGAVAAQPAAERGGEGSRPVRQPEHHLPPDYAEMAVDGGTLEGALRALNASLRFIP